MIFDRKVSLSPCFGYTLEMHQFMIAQKSNCTITPSDKTSATSENFVLTCLCQKHIFIYVFAGDSSVAIFLFLFFGIFCTNEGQNHCVNRTDSQASIILLDCLIQ